MGLNEVINVTSHWGIIIVFSSFFHSCCFLSQMEPAQRLTLQRRANRTHLHWQGDQGQSLVMAQQSALQAWCCHFCHSAFGCLFSVWLRSSRYHSIPESWPASKSCGRGGSGRGTCTIKGPTPEPAAADSMRSHQPQIPCPSTKVAACSWEGLRVAQCCFYLAKYIFLIKISPQSYKMIHNKSWRC